MANAIQQHLEQVTVDNLMDFRADSFIMYASARGIKIGVSGQGQFVVLDKEEKYIFNNPAIAIQKYTDLVNE